MLFEFLLYINVCCEILEFSVPKCLFNNRDCLLMPEIGGPGFRTQQGKEGNMYGIKELKAVIMLSYLTDPMLEQITSVTSFVKIKAGEYVFRQDDYAKNLWAVVNGRVGLEFEVSPTKRVLVTELTGGMTFGLSSMVDMEPQNYMGSAKAITDLELFKWSASDLNELFFKNCEMGFIVMKRIAKILVTRLQIKNIQFSGSYDR